MKGQKHPLGAGMELLGKELLPVQFLCVFLGTKQSCPKLF